eukprot:evm.model.NODE_32899_length_17417_cov_14.877476.7
MPERSIAWVPVEGMSGSERFCYGYLEVLAAKECRRLVEQALHAAAVGGEEGAGGEGRGEGAGGGGRGLLHSAAVGAVAAAAGSGGAGGGGGGREGGGVVPQRVLTREEQAQVLTQAIQHGGEG